MSSDPQDDTQTGRHTGEAARFLNKVKLAARQKVTKASNDRANALAAAHQQAQASLATAHTKAMEVFGQNLHSVYMATNNMGWVQTDATGAVKQKRIPLTVGLFSDIAVDAAARRIYAIAEGADVINASGELVHVKSELFYISMDRSFVTFSEIMSARVKFAFWPEQMFADCLALDTADGSVYGTSKNGSILRMDLSDGTTSTIFKSPGTRFTSIALDTLNRTIYCANSPEFDDVDARARCGIRVIGYDGSEVKTAPMPVALWDKIPMKMVVDGKNGYLYWTTFHSILRARLDLLEATILLAIPDFVPEGFGSIALDASSQLLYWNKSIFAEAKITVFRSFTNGDLEPVKVFDLHPVLRTQLSTMVIVTLSGEAAQVTSSAVHQRDRAHTQASQKLAQAHQDAAQSVQGAHSKLEAAHETAARDITANQQKATQKRQDEQAKAQAKQADAARQLSDANQYDARKRQDAHNEAQSILDAKRQEAERVKQPAQDKLNAARIRQQNS